MRKIGLTGNIGSGKTTVSKIFEVLGVPVFYADDEAKRVMAADDLLIQGIRETFGPASYFEDGSLNRKHIASIVFNDDQQLASLNALVHPAVFRAFDSWCLRFQHAPYIVKEAALLFESDSYKMCDETIMVQAPLALRINRVMQRDGLTQKEIERREGYQFAPEKKTKLANYVINNDETELVIPQVLQLHAQFSRTTA